MSALRYGLVGNKYWQTKFRNGKARHQDIELLTFDLTDVKSWFPFDTFAP